MIPDWRNVVTAVLGLHCAMGVVPGLALSTSARAGPQQFLVVGSFPNVYLSGVTDDEVFVRDLFPPKEAKWVAANTRGQALFCLQSREGISLVRVNLPEGKQEKLQLEPDKIPDRLYGDLSPDGKKLCFARFSRWPIGKIHVLDLDSGETQVVFGQNGDVAVTPPAWSSEGNSVGYQFCPKDSLLEDGYALAVSTWDGEQWKGRVISPPSMPCTRYLWRRESPHWDPTGQLLIFYARYTEAERGLQTYLVRRDGSELQHVADASSSSAWTRDGKAILYRQDVGVFLYHLASHVSEKLLPNEGVYWPRLSPDMKYIAYSDRSGVVHIADKDGADRRRVIDLGDLDSVDFLRWISLRRN